MIKLKRPRKLSAMFEDTDARALEQQAEDNGRSLASELRHAVSESLKKNGRKT